MQGLIDVIKELTYPKQQYFIYFYIFPKVLFLFIMTPKNLIEIELSSNHPTLAEF